MRNPSKAVAIIPKDGGFEISIPAEALKLKQEALALAVPIIRVETPEDQAKAIAVVANLKGISKQVEADREAVKKPYLEAGRAIDASAKKYIEEINSRAASIESMLSEYRRKENEKIEAARREEEKKRREAEESARKEQERLEREERDRLEVIARAEQAEFDRKQAEENARLAKSAKEKKDAQAEVDRLKKIEDDAAKASMQAQDDQMQAEIDASEAEDERARQEATVSVVIEAPSTKATGSIARERIEFEVTDIEAVYAWDSANREKMIAFRGRKPLMTIIKMQLVDADFRALLKTLTEEEVSQIPGIKISKNTKVSVKPVSSNQFKLQ